MKLTMTERDKRLLYYIGIVLLAVVLFVGLIRPASDRRAALRSELESSDFEVQETEMALSETPGLKATYEQLQSEWAVATGNLYPLMTNDAVDDMLTGLVLRHEMVPLQLQIGQPTNVELAVFGASADASAAGPVEILPVTLSGQGNIEQVMELVDDVEANSPGLRITGISTSIPTAVIQDGEQILTGNFTLNVEVYMCDRSL